MRESYNSRIYLRALEMTDLERTHRWHNDPELYENLAGVFRWVSQSAEEEWLRKRCAYSGEELNLAICQRDDHAHIGNVYLRRIDWIARTAEIGMFIGDEKKRGQGLGEEALRQVIEYAFTTLGIRRVYLTVLASNERAKKLYAKCGFREEGCLRQHIFKQGRYEDLLVMGLLESEWEENFSQ